MRKLLTALGVVAALVAVAATGGAATATASSDAQYIVVFNQENGLPANADKLVAAADGTINYRWPEIGAIGAVSANPNFIEAIEAAPSVKAADPDIAPQWVPDVTDLVGSDPIIADAENNGGTYAPTGRDPQPMPDPLGYEQWDKMRMNATTTGSYAVQRGRRDVVVAFLDTGVELFPVPHPDIVPNLDIARSRSFVATEPTLDDIHGHGSWIASAIASPINAFGISGIAPNVTLVSLKVCNRLGRCPFVSIVSAYIYAGLNHFDVASASIGGYLNRRDFSAFYVAEHRAVQFARQNGVLPVAALGNNGADLSDGSIFQDIIEVPGEIAGVVGVSATGYYDQKAHYSNYGMGSADLSAPGGSTRNYTGVPGSGAAPGYRGEGRVLGAWSAEGAAGFPPVLREEECVGGDPGTGVACAFYTWVQGTSMATPHVSGVAALIISQYGDFTPSNQNKAHMPPQQVESLLQITANNQPCPEPRTVIQGPGVGFPPGLLFPTATCQGADVSGGGDGYTSFFGKGISDALKAVTFQNPNAGG